MVFYMCLVFLISMAFKMAEKRYLGHLRPREITLEKPDRAVV
jgi:arginine/ornithine transport system permease protein